MDTVEPFNVGECQSELLSMLQRDANPGEFAEMSKRVEARVHDPAERSLLTRSIQSAVAVHEQRALQHRREKGLQVLLDTAHDLTAMRDLELVLQAIVRRARQIFSADIGYLTHFDRLRNDFYIRATDGAISERFRNVRVPPDHGICGYILENKAPYHSTSYLTDRGFTHEPGIDRAIEDEGVRSLLGAPLMAGAHCIGILCICDRQSRSYAPWEISLLATLAAQAAVAIESARLFQETQVALKRAEEANASLHTQAEEIEAAAEAHERMTRLVSRGCTIIDILNMAASILDGHVALLNEAEELTHTATTGPSVPDLQQIASQDEVQRALTESRISGRSQLVRVGQDLELRVLALMGAERLLGSILIVTRQNLTQMQVRTFERAALVAGVVLLSQERSELVASNETAAVLRALIKGLPESAAASRGRTKQLGLDLSAPLGLLVLSVEAPHIEYALRRIRVPSLRGVAIEECEGLIVALYQQDHFPALQNAIQTKLVEDPRLGTLGVVSSGVSGVDLLPQTFRALSRCIDILRALGRKCELVQESALSMYALLFEQHQAADVSGFIEATLGSLLAHDQRRNGDLAGTLLAYLEHHHNAKATADSMNIHVNTLRQRLEAIDAILGSWREGGRSLELHVALRMNVLRRVMSHDPQ